MVTVAVAASSLVACEATKSRTPTSPNVAGPLAGVSITTPAPVSPANGTEVLNTETVRLVFGNAASNSERPFWYVVELAADAGFTTKLYTNPKVTPAAGGQTTVVIDAQLGAEATYYWRVKAEDGANSSEFSSAAHFDLVIPVVIDPPTAVSPTNGQTTSNNTPELVLNNGRVEGRAGSVEYRFEVSTDQAFTNIVSVAHVARSGGSQTVHPSAPLPQGSLLYWRARATNGIIVSAPSNTASFRTPAPPAPPSGGGGGGGWNPPPSIPGGRTPDPGPNTFCSDTAGNTRSYCLPLPDHYSVVQRVAAQYPQALANSCQEHGGTWEFMDRVVDALRQVDTRWGYNGKRGNPGDPSLDAIAYHFGPGPDAGSRDVHVVDIISGHCGPGPSPGFGNVTNFNGAGAIWISRGRF